MTILSLAQVMNLPCGRYVLFALPKIVLRGVSCLFVRYFPSWPRHSVSLKGLQPFLAKRRRNGKRQTQIFARAQKAHPNDGGRQLCHGEVGLYYRSSPARMLGLASVLSRVIPPFFDRVEWTTRARRSPELEAFSQAKSEACRCCSGPSSLR